MLRLARHFRYAVSNICRVATEDRLDVESWELRSESFSSSLPRLLPLHPTNATQSITPEMLSPHPPSWERWLPHWRIARATRAFFAAALLIAFHPPAPAADAPLRTLTTIREVSELSAEEAARQYPVHLRAIVTGVNVSPACFLTDETGSTYYGRPGATSDLVPGQLVEIEAVTRPGSFSSHVLERKSTVIGTAPLPAPESVTFDQLSLGAADSHYVEIGGIVRSAQYIEKFRCLDIQLAAKGGLLRVYLFHPADTEGNSLIDAKVRMRGSVSSRFNQNRQWIAARLNVDGIANITIEVPPPADPFAIPAHSASSLGRFEPQPSGFAHRVKVTGVVLYQEPGEALYLRDEDRALLLQTRQTLPVTPGDVVDALGFLGMGVYSPYLDDTQYRRVRSGSPAKPVLTSAKQLLLGEHNADLVSIDADLVNSVERGDEQTLVLQSEDVLFNAQYLRTATQPFLPAMRNGSRLRLTGISTVLETAEKSSAISPKSFRLKLVSPESVTVLREPSWWTPARLLWALGAMVFIVALGACWIWLLRRRVTEQTQIILEKVQHGAVLEERTRIARDFHDTLEQELAGLSMQLDAVGRKFDQAPPTARPSLDLARRMLMHCRLEAKRSVWDLRCMALEQGDLVDALHEVTQPILAGQNAKLTFHIEGGRRRLPGIIERDLLRIGQEAVTNAIKHARANCIDVYFSFAGAKVTLTITDDGSGFNASKLPAAASGHFGLAGIGERAAKLGGTLSVETCPGAGTRLVIEVPLHEETTEAPTPESLLSGA